MAEAPPRQDGAQPRDPGQGPVSLRALAGFVLVMLAILAAMLPLGSMSQALRGAAPVPHAGLSFQSAGQCAACHAEIHREWQQSFMSRAWSSPVFQLEFKRFLKTQGADRDPAHPQRAACLRCHAPLAVLSRDLALRNPASREGVSCEACHRVALAHERPLGNILVMDPDPHVQYGNRVSRNAFHAVRRSEAMPRSQLCGGCHLDVDRKSGIALERTYQEWHAGPMAARGLQCAACHMPRTATPGAGGATHASHRFHGGHSGSPLLRGAVSVLLERRPPDTVVVTLENVSVGHNFPTGGAHPSRAVLTLEVRDRRGKVLHAAERIYGYGNDLTRSTLRADAAIVDTTLKPAERRVETFTLPPWREGQRVSAMLRYRLLPPGYERDLPRGLYAQHYAPVVIAEAWLR